MSSKTDYDKIVKKKVKQIRSTQQAAAKLYTNPKAKAAALKAAGDTKANKERASAVLDREIRLAARKRK